MAPTPKTLQIKSFGCQMNAYDAERMAEALAAHGYEETANIAEAELVILNPCHIRAKAAETVYSELGLAASEDEVVPHQSCAAMHLDLEVGLAVTVGVA